MKGRILYLDNIRIFLISYVIAGHVSVAYGALGGGNWYYIEPAQGFATKAAFYLFDMLAYSFLMAMFIFISGYFTPASLERKGSLGFLKDRIFRLFIPFVLYYFLLGPVTRYISMLAKGYEGSIFEFWKGMYQSGIYGYTGVMWFVELILAFSFLYAAFRYVFPGGLWKRTDDRFPSNLSIAVFILMVGFAGFIARLAFPMGGGYLGARPLASLVLFGTAFFLGTTAWRYQWLDKLSDKTAWQWFWVALVVMVAPLVIFLLFRKSISIAGIKGSGTAGSLIYSYWEVIKCVGTGMLSIVIFRRYFDRQGKMAAAMGRSAFAAYVLHPMICVTFMYLLSGVQLHGLIKFALVAPLSIVCTFAVSWLFVKIPGVNKIF